MYTIDKDKAKKVLVEEYDYKPYQADLFLERFPALHEELAEPVENWLEDREIPDISVGGLSVQEILRTQRSHFLLVVQYLNRLLDEDLPADKREQLIRTLRKPAVEW